MFHEKGQPLEASNANIIVIDFHSEWNSNFWYAQLHFECKLENHILPHQNKVKSI